MATSPQHCVEVRAHRWGAEARPEADRRTSTPELVVPQSQCTRQPPALEASSSQHQSNDDPWCLGSSTGCLVRQGEYCQSPIVSRHDCSPWPRPAAVEGPGFVLWEEGQFLGWNQTYFWKNASRIGQGTGSVLQWQHQPMSRLHLSQTTRYPWLLEDLEEEERRKGREKGQCQILLTSGGSFLGATLILEVAADWWHREERA